jgi:hypothetical protein
MWEAQFTPLLLLGSRIRSCRCVHEFICLLLDNWTLILGDEYMDIDLFDRD